MNGATTTEVGVVSGDAGANVGGDATVTVTVDLDANTYDLAVTGTGLISGTGSATGIAFDNNVDIDTVRIYLDELSNGCCGDKEIDDINIKTAATTYSDSTLSTGNTAEYRVSAINSIGTGVASDTASATTFTVPAKPTALSATAGNTQVSLSWTAPNNGGSAITDYTVEFKLSTDSTFATFNDGVSTATTATVTGLTNGLSYDFRVSAINSIGTGAVSDTASATPAPTVTRIGTWSSGTTPTLSHTNGAGSDRIMIVAVGAEISTTTDVTAVSYGGQALTQGPQITAGTGFSYRIEIWYLLEAGIAAATNTIIIPTFGAPPPANRMIAAATYGGVDQTTPIPEQNTDSTASSTPNPLTGADIVEADGNAVVGAGGVGNGGNSATWNAAMTEQADFSAASSAMTVADRLSTTNANVDIEPTWASQNRAALVSIEIAAVAVDPQMLDSTPNNNDGTNEGSLDAAGKISNGQDFIPADEIELGTWSVSGSTITVSAWVNADAFNDDPRILSKAVGGNAEDHVVMMSTSGAGDTFLRSRIKTGTSNTSGTTTLLSTTNPLVAGIWALVAITYDGSNMRIFKDGTEIASVGKTGALRENAWKIAIGNNPDNTSTAFGSWDGKIDEVRILSIARDSNWLTTEYNNQNSPGTFMSFSNQTAATVSKSGAYGISTNNSKAYGTINNQSVSGSITAGEWNHISLTYNKDAGGTDEIKLYLNGTQSATGDYSTAISTNNNNLILGDMVGLLGKMDEIRIWNDVRTQQEIRENMHRIVTPGSETNLVAYWKLNESSGTSAPDSKGSNTGTLFNMTDGDWVASTAPFGGGIVNSTTSFTSGTATLGTFSLTTTNSFDNPVDITSTEILNAPNILPSVANPLDDRYWVVDVFGTPGTYTANLTFTLPSGYLNTGDEANLKLYNRSSNSDGSWTLLVSGASNVTSTTVTFNGVSTLGQFTIGSNGTSPLPVELVSFTGKVKDQNVYLKWSTATEVNNYGFEVERKVSSKSASSGATGNWEKIAFLEGFGNSNSPKKYSFTDEGISYGVYTYRLKQIDNDGTYEYSKEIEIDAGKIPNDFILEQNYPNPFNPSTTIRFAINESVPTSLKIYDVLGNEVEELFNERTEAGKVYNLEFNAAQLPSGVYFYRLQAGEYIGTKRMVLLR
ncbi:MAG: fibronectin type III domain-containing protein [Bacteroidetes bacterium]|nr:fibronectin type III domain-containing protein [Bacteroidota bacterium]